MSLPTRPARSWSACRGRAASWTQRRVADGGALLAAALLPAVMAGDAGASTPSAEVMRYEGGGLLHGIEVDCVLDAFDVCSGWLWVFSETEGAVWGSVLNAQDCPGSCSTTRNVKEIYVYTVCDATPARFGGVRLHAVDGVGCLTATLFESGPATITSCSSGNRWTVFTTPGVPVSGPFAVTVTWGPEASGVNEVRFALDNALANLYCMMNPSSHGVFPGCASSEVDCGTWSMPGARTYIYVTDLNGDGVLEDICALYGAPYPISYPYSYTYSYTPANLVLGVGLACDGGTATERGSWGRVKTLFE